MACLISDSERNEKGRKMIIIFLKGTYWSTAEGAEFADVPVNAILKLGEANDKSIIFSCDYQDRVLKGSVVASGEQGSPLLNGTYRENYAGGVEGTTEFKFAQNGDNYLFVGKWLYGSGTGRWVFDLHEVSRRKESDTQG
jgi:hypothetical protein